jgi:oxygen-dependent protoporphyrinogen oxidase
MYDCIIIGAGISGLSVAAGLSMRGKEVLVLDKASRVGGTMVSIRRQGYLIDFGPTTMLHTTPVIDELVRYAGLQQDLCFANPQSQKRYIVRHGRMHALPRGPASFMTSSLFSTPAKLRVLREPFIPRGSGEESIGGFAERRLGREVLDYAIAPFVSGVYAGDPARLSVQWAFPKLHALEQQYGSLIRGAVLGARQRQERASEHRKDTAKVFSFKHGNSAWPEALAARLGARVRLECTITQVSHEQGGYTIAYAGPHGAAQVHGHSLVLAVPADALDLFMHRCNARYLGGVASITYAPVVQLFLGFRRQDIGHPLDGFGVLIPQRENQRLLGVLWPSSLFPSRAPAGSVALTAFLGGMLQPDMVAQPEDELLAIGLDALTPLLDVHGTPEVFAVKTWRRAIPQYHLGYGTYLRLMEAFEANTPGVFLSSNCRGGIAVGDCIRQSADTAAKVMAYLEATT